ncbi:sugar-transfer associated ATP-grasp domain-containing protein [Natrarchaeobius sp. A-rgal3]|uniref:sugar-transfer associated ATP-grasp domain-containing protein n=1 Tax=Natrarchaeobius versutus TaxID=1679078 RepID=UPI00350F4240
MNVRQLYHAARGVQGLAVTERESSVSRPFRRRLWLWRRGFLTRSDALYDLDESTADTYVNDYQRFVRSKRINGTWSVALSNKLLFHRVMQPFDAERMAVYGMLRDGTYHPVDDRNDEPAEPATKLHELADGGPSLAVASGAERDRAEETRGGRASRDGQGASETRNAAQRVVERLEEDEWLVLKWVRGGGGNNVLLCRRTEDGYLVNGDRYADAEFRSMVSNLDEYIVCEYVEQGPFAAELYPETPNTVRIVTMYDETAGEPFVAAAIHRMGTGDSGPLDNFSQGGLSAQIDRETGQLSAGAKLPVDGEVGWYARHPDTGTPIADAQIPGWRRIRERVLEIADGCSFVPYVGWDVVVTDDEGSFTVLEANSYPGLKSIQVHGPLLTDDRVRRFYERYGVC